MTLKTSTALIIVDVQNDFCPGGNLAVEGGDEIVDTINKMGGEALYDLTVITQDFHPPGHKSFFTTHGLAPDPETGELPTVEMPYGTQVLWPDHCVQGTEGAEFHKGLIILDGDLVLQKGTDINIDSYSGFFENDQETRPRFSNGETLTDTLKAQGVTKVVFTGLAYDFCVGWHALDARKEGFEAVVVKDATRAIALPIKDKEGNIIGNTEVAMDEQLAEAGVKVVNYADLKEALDFDQPAPGNDKGPA